MEFVSELEFGDRVVMDGDDSIVGTVTGFMVHSNLYHMVEVSWLHNGEAKCAWINYWRLTKKISKENSPTPPVSPHTVK